MAPIVAYLGGWPQFVHVAGRPVKGGPPRCAPRSAASGAANQRLVRRALTFFAGVGAGDLTAVVRAAVVLAGALAGALVAALVAGAAVFTAAALRAIELECDIVLKGTNVDGVYSADPKKDPNATRYDQISHDDVISQNLRVMDTAAFALARDNNMPIIVYSLDDKEGLSGVLAGRVRSTRVGKPL
jgi:hypothetical protein